MNIVMLAAGTSSRMGKINKMLIPVNGMAMAAHCCINALKYLESLEEKSRLIVVVGYRRVSLHKALKPCRDFIEKTNSRIELIEVFNKSFKKGQFSSVKSGVSNVPDCEDFFISLADMPFIKPENYKEIAGKLGKFSAVRPFFNNTPGHPVLLSSSLKEKILKTQDLSSVSRILENADVNGLAFQNRSCIEDFDKPEDLCGLLI